MYIVYVFILYVLSQIRQTFVRDNTKDDWTGREEYFFMETEPLAGLDGEGVGLVGGVAAVDVDVDPPALPPHPDTSLLGLGSLSISLSKISFFRFRTKTVL